MEFVDQNITEFDLIKDMCSDMGCWRKKVEKEIVMGRLWEHLNGWTEYLVGWKKRHIIEGQLEIRCQHICKWN